jgi:hypothetical protein
MDQEDVRIRRLLIVGSASALAGLIGTVLLITILIATNFNPLEWTE